MEPVEIEFVMGGDLAERLAERLADARVNAAGLGSAADAALRKLRDNLAGESQALKQVEADVKNIEKTFAKMAPGAEKMAMGQELSAAKKALQEQKVIVEDLKQQVKEAAAAHVSIRTEQMHITDQMRRMRMAGEENTKEYDLLRQKMVEIKDAAEEVNKETRLGASAGGGVFAGMVDAAKGVSGAFQTAQGAMALFGVENENLEKIQTRLIALMSITNGLQEVANTLHAASAARITLVSGAKKLWAAATTFLNVQLGIAVGLSKALMASGIGLLLAGIGLLVSKIIEWRKNQAEANKQSEAAQKQAEALAAQQDKLAADYGRQRAQIESLRAALHSETLEYDKKQEVIKKLQAIIPNYTASLGKEGQVIRENAAALDAYMMSLEKSLKLKAAQEELEGLYKDLYKIDSHKSQEGKDTQEEVFQVRTSDLSPHASAVKEKQERIIKEEMAAREAKEVKDLQERIDKIKGYIGDNNLVDIAKPQKSSHTRREFYDAAADVQALLRDISEKQQTLQMQMMEDNLQKRLWALDTEQAREADKIAEGEQKIVNAYNQSRKDIKGFKPAASLADIDPAAAEKVQQEKTALTQKYAAKRAAIEMDGDAKIAQARQAALEEQAIIPNYTASVICPVIFSLPAISFHCVPKALLR